MHQCNIQFIVSSWLIRKKTDRRPGRRWRFWRLCWWVVSWVPPGAGSGRVPSSKRRLEPSLCINCFAHHSCTHMNSKRINLHTYLRLELTGTALRPCPCDVCRGGSRPHPILTWTRRLTWTTSFCCFCFWSAPGETTHKPHTLTTATFTMTFRSIYPTDLWRHSEHS